MSNFFKNFLLKIIDRQKYKELKILEVIDSNKKKFHNSFENQINNIQKKIDTKDIRDRNSGSVTGS